MHRRPFQPESWSIAYRCLGFTGSHGVLHFVVFSVCLTNYQGFGFSMSDGGSGHGLGFKV